MAVKAVENHLRAQPGERQDGPEAIHRGLQRADESQIVRILYAASAAFDGCDFDVDEFEDQDQCSRVHQAE